MAAGDDWIERGYRGGEWINVEGQESCVFDFGEHATKFTTKFVDILCTFNTTDSSFFNLFIYFATKGHCLIKQQGCSVNV